MRISRRDFIRQAALAGAAALTGSLAHGQQQRRPNILFIITDQQPTSCVGAYGNPVLRTPNLNQLAREGALLEHFYISAFPCSPSRACMLTGRYAHRHGVVINDVPLDPKIPCLGDIAKQAGYSTAYFGKWHLSGHMYRDYRRYEKGKEVQTGHWYFQRVEDPQDFEFKRVPGGTGEDEPQHGFDHWVGGWRHYHRFLREEGLGKFLEGRLIGNHNIAPSGGEGQHIYSLLDEHPHMSAFLAGECERWVRKQA